MASIVTLSSKVKGDVVTPEHPDYANALHRWARNAEKNAAVVVFVKDAIDVSTAILFAQENGLPIAIRGGGHSPTGASSVEGGLVVDLSRHLNGVRVDAAKRLAYVGGGALWETVDKSVIEHGLGIVGGTVNHTGVGGLILGGGIGFLSGEQGLTIDNLVQVTLVSADGTIHRANETENPDLFFGVRGGGCNFGVVTEFVLALYPQRKTVFAGPIIFPGSSLHQLVNFAQNWYANISEKEAMLFVITCRPDGTPIVACTVFYNGSEEEGRTKFKGLYEIGPIRDLAKEVPYEILNSLQNEWVQPGNGIYWKGVAHDGPDWRPIADAYEKVVEITKGGKFFVQVIYEWIPLGKINSVPANQTAFRRSSKPNCLASIGWPGNTHSEEKVDEARLLASQVAGCVVGGVSKLKDIQSQSYTNYDPEGIIGDKDEVKDKAKIVFGANYPALQKIKKKYDPKNIFNRWFPITPA